LIATQYESRLGRRTRSRRRLSSRSRTVELSGFISARTPSSTKKELPAAVAALS